MLTKKYVTLAAITCVLSIAATLSTARAQDADSRPLVAVYPIKRPSDAQPKPDANVKTNAAPINTANEAVYQFLEKANLDPNIIVLNIEDGLRKGKKVRLFERGAAGLDSIRQEQFKAECGNGSTNTQGQVLQPGQVVTPNAQIVDECLKRFAGNAAATGQLKNAEFIVDVAIMDVAIGDAIYEPIPEMPGKFRRLINCKIDLAVKVLDSTTGQVKFQALVPAAYTEKRVVQSQVNPVIDWRAIWNGLATDAGQKSAAAINGAIKS